MSLRDEIAEDISSDDFEDDFFSEVELNGTTISAMVGIEMVDESLEMGGTVRESEREFKFRRHDLLSLGITAGLDSAIIYEGECYDVISADARPEWPLVAVRAVLRR